MGKVIRLIETSMPLRIPAVVVTILLLLTGIARAGLLPPAGSIFRPAGLNPGDLYRIVFVTSTTRNAISSDIADYNTFVNDAANTMGTLTAPLGTTWFAIGSTQTVDARDNTGTNPSSTGVPIFLVDGLTKIADNNADLWDGTIDASINLNEKGTTPDPNTTGDGPWTGTQIDGRRTTTQAIPDPTTPLGAIAYDFITIGLTNSTNNEWINTGHAAWSGPINLEPPNFTFFDRPMYAMSTALTAIPEPQTALLFGIVGVGAIGLKILKPKRKAA